MLEEYVVLEASSTLDAHEILKREVIDLILLDLKIPNVNGSVMYDLIEQFHKNLKVVVISVYPIDLQKRVIPGAYDYYDKSDKKYPLQRLHLSLYIGSTRIRSWTPGGFF